MCGSNKEVVSHASFCRRASKDLEKSKYIFKSAGSKDCSQGPTLSVHAIDHGLLLSFPSKVKFPKKDKLEDPTLYQYALFSDNVLAASVVVNSTVMNAKESQKHVFHLIGDKLNFGAMKMWFLLNPPRKAAMHVENVDDFKWLNSSYCPVLHQLESAAMKEYYFKADHSTTLSTCSSMLNHLHFYLPQVYQKLEKILFLDDDIVLEKDLTPLWSVDLHGNVNGSVETCGESFRRFEKYLNFSNLHIAMHFDPNSCGWAYGMNVFDLKEWKKQDITGIYHKWQNMNEDRVLWKLGTLPPRFSHWLLVNQVYAPKKIKAMDHVLSKAREQFYGCTTVTTKLQAMLQSEDKQGPWKNKVKF